MVWRGSASYDVAIVGAGPCGSATALSFAQRGARVLLVEGNPRASARFAGEWIHPPGVRALRQLGVDLGEASGPGAPASDRAREAWSGRGFVLLWEPAGDPVALPYGSELGLSCDHERLVGMLRSRVLEHANVEYLPMARVRALEGHSLHIEDRRSSTEGAVQAERIIGADGRSSVVRKCLGLPADSTALSHMAAVDLRGTELPFEGLGHVVLGGPGPMLLYRVEPDRIRVCLDVPLNEESSLRRPTALFEAFAPHLPESLREAFRSSLTGRPVRWAAAAFRPRTSFGKGAVWLAGDAVGHTHPCTAIGLTQAFGDALAASSCKTLREYQRLRTNQTAELLSNVLYHVFRRSDTSALELRHALFDVLRQSEHERLRTMAILSTEDNSKFSFSLAFLKAAGRTFMRAARTPEAPISERMSRVGACGEWLKWPAAALGGFSPSGAVSRVDRTARAGLAADGAPAAPPRSSTPAANPIDSSALIRPPTAALAAPSDSLDDFAFCEQSLIEVSRSFAEPIRLLPEELKRALCVGYLLCRVVDTVEDHAAIPLAKRDELFASFLDVLNGLAASDDLERRFADVEGDDPELRLARSTSRVLGVFGAQRAATRDATRAWVSEMTHGMRLYAHRPTGSDGVVALHSIADLERYCYFAAGTVGLMITDLFVDHLHRSGKQRLEAGLRNSAESFGVGLQLVNILKDVTHDLERRWCYVPRSMLCQHGLTPLDLLDTRKRAQAHQAVAPLFERANYHLETALEYTLTLPASERELRLFCLLPLWMAAATLRVARGNDDMFAPGRPVKIDRKEAGEIAAFCARFSGDDEALRVGYRQLKSSEPRLSRMLS